MWDRRALGMPSRLIPGSAPGHTSGDARGRRECRPVVAEVLEVGVVGLVAGSNQTLALGKAFASSTSCRCSKGADRNLALPPALGPGIHRAGVIEAEAGERTCF